MPSKPTQLLSIFARLTATHVWGVALALLLAIGIWLGRHLDSREVSQLRSALSTLPAAPNGVHDSPLLLDSRGRPLTFWGENFHHHQPLAELGKIPAHALIAAEDQRFYWGLGVDGIAILREASRFITTGTVGSGASTIASQLVKDILGHRRRSLSAKLKEFAYGFYLHRQFSAKTLLTAYINRIYLGQRSVGFRAAAWRYFARPYHKLNTKEQLSLIALIPSPSRNNPMFDKADHQNLTRKFIARLTRRGVLSRRVSSRILAQPLRYDFGQLHPPSIGYFRDYAAQQSRKLLGLEPDEPLPRGLRIATGYSSRHHRQVASAIAAGDYTPLEQRVMPKGTAVQAAALWVDSLSGEIRVMIGGRDYRQSRYNRTVLSQRSPGSTLKPIILALAIKNGYRLSTRFQNYKYSHHPVKGQVYDASYSNLSLLEGFTLSSNHLMLRLGETIGLRPFLAAAKTLGITTPLKPEWGSIIGSSEVSFFDLARLYSSFASGGARKPVHGIRQLSRGDTLIYAADTTADAVLAASVAENVNQALRRAAVTGVGARSEAKRLGYGGKTGTSNGMRDNWYCGIADGLVGVVWVGADQGQGFPGLKGGGARYALPLWLASLPAKGAAAAVASGPGTLAGSGDERLPEFIDLSGGASDGASDSIDDYFAPLLF